MNQSPKYRVLADRLRADIKRGAYKDGERLNTENELAALYGMSRQTVRQALDVLEGEGIILRKRGSGTYVGLPGAAREKTGRVGVITTYITEYIFPSILRGIEGELSEGGYTMELAATYNRVDNERRMLLDYLQKPVDGLIIEGTKTALPNPNIPLYEKLSEIGVPCVFINGYYEALERPVYVVTDDCGGGREAIAYLTARGHSRIAGAFKADDMQGHRRYAGYIQGMMEAGLELTDEWVTWFTTEDKDQGMLESLILDRARDCTAAVLYNDEIAVRVLRALQKRGEEGRLSIVSFDDSAYGNMVAGPIPSLHHPKEEVGRLAARKLLNLIAGEAESPAILTWHIANAAP